jgi:hypothetical protein
MPEASPDLFEIIATTRSMRRLKPDPVPAELIRKVLEAGTAAPSGGNMQRWRFLVVTDPKVKETVGAFYKRAWDETVYPRYSAGAPAPGTSPERFRRMLDAAQHLADYIHEAPVWIMPCLGEQTRPARPDLRSTRRAEHVAGGSGARLGCDADDAVSGFREGGRSRTRLPGRCAFLRAPADRLSGGPVRAGSTRTARRGRLRKPMGPTLSALSLVQNEGSR